LPDHAQAHPSTAPLRAIVYDVPERALASWRGQLKERIALDGTRDYGFRFRGSTCNDQGRIVYFNLNVKLAPTPEGWRIDDARIGLDREEPNLSRLCAWQSERGAFLERLAQPAHFCGMGLEETIQSLREVNPAGCVCTRAMADHKWRIVLSTIHYVLAQQLAPGDSE
jgi:hypothetical protein